MSDQLVGKVFIVSPIDQETNEPIELYFAVTEGGYLIHMEKMDSDIPASVVHDELAKLLNGLESTTGRYNEFIKNRNRYVTRMAVVPPLTIADARRIDEKYKMTKEQRMQAFQKEKDLWMR